MPRQITLNDFLDAEQLEAAHKLYRECENTNEQFARRCANEIITPNMAEIERKLDGKFDAKYLAYACEYVFKRI